MRLPSCTCAVVVFLAAFASAQIARTSEPRKVGVVYLVDVLSSSRSPSSSDDDALTNSIPDSTPSLVPSLLLISPIPDTEDLPDGVYFRPVDGQPLDKPEVSVKIFIFYSMLRPKIHIHLTVKIDSCRIERTMSSPVKSIRVSDDNLILNSTLHLRNQYQKEFSLQISKINLR